jgi:hypothetical protein
MLLAVTSPSKLNTRAFAAYPSPKRSGNSTRLRIVAVGIDGGGIVRSSGVLKPGRERIAEQYHVANLAELGQRRTPVRVPQEAAVADEPWGRGIATEQRSHYELKLVNEVCGEGPGMDGRMRRSARTWESARASPSFVITAQVMPTTGPVALGPPALSEAIPKHAVTSTRWAIIAATGPT